MKKKILSLSIILILTFAMGNIAFTQNILYVDGGMTNSGDGKSWLTAYKTIGEAESAAAANDEIWVKRGTYLLISTFIGLNKPIRLYGGFSGVETQRDQRDWKVNVTKCLSENLLINKIIKHEDKMTPRT